MLFFVIKTCQIEWRQKAAALKKTKMPRNVRQPTYMGFFFFLAGCASFALVHGREGSQASRPPLRTLRRENQLAFNGERGSSEGIGKTRRVIPQTRCVDLIALQIDFKRFVIQSEGRMQVIRPWNATGRSAEDCGDGRRDGQSDSGETERLCLGSITRQGGCVHTHEDSSQEEVHIS